PAQRAEAHRREVRLRPRPVRRLHGDCRRQSGPLVLDAGIERVGEESDDDRRPRHAREAASAASGLHRRAGGAMRLLRRRHGDERCGGARAQAGSDTRGCAAGARRQLVPVRHARANSAGNGARGREEGDLSARGLTGHAQASPRQMTSNHASAVLARRAFLQAGGALVVGFMLPGAVLAQRVARADIPRGKTLDAGEVDGFIAINADGSVTIYSGKVDLGQGLRIAIPQMAAEELGIGVERIALVEGDTALTPDQGATAGSSGIVRGGVQIRQAAATARETLIGLAAARTGKSAADFDAIDGEVRPKSGGAGIRFGDLVGDQRLGVKVDLKAKLRDPASYRIVGQPLARPDIPGKVGGRHVFVHDFKIDGMLHGRVVRPPAVGAKLAAVDEASISAIPGARVVRINDFVAVVAASEWDAVCAARMLKVQWSEPAPLLGAGAVREWMRSGP